MNQVSHLYLHVPFCRRQCPYCDYPVHAAGSADLAVWVRALSGELRLREATGVSISDLETLLVGGGTPSVLGVGATRGVTSILGKERLLGVKEWTIEANPEDVDSELLDEWRGAGVNRINIGVQSMSNDALEWLGRAHSHDHARSAIEITAASGIQTWGVDLLFGLPREIDSDPASSLREIIALEVPHVSLYELVAEPGTPLGERVASGEVRLADEDHRTDQYLALFGLLVAEGYHAYEMTAFARPGHVSQHAVAILEGRPWIGLGPGAHSHFSGRQVWNLKDWQGYSRSVAEGELPEAECHIETLGRSSPEGIWFGLRRWEGISREELSSGAREMADTWVRKGLAAKDPLRVRLTPEGWLRMDELSVELAQLEASIDRSSPGFGLKS